MAEQGLRSIVVKRLHSAVGYLTPRQKEDEEPGKSA